VSPLFGGAFVEDFGGRKLHHGRMRQATISFLERIPSPKTRRRNSGSTFPTFGRRRRMTRREWSKERDLNKEYLSVDCYLDEGGGK